MKVLSLEVREGYCIHTDDPVVRISVNLVDEGGERHRKTVLVENRADPLEVVKALRELADAVGGGA